MSEQKLGSESTAQSWLQDATHQAFLCADAKRQLAFFRPSLRPDGGFDTLDHVGKAMPRPAQQLHTTTRLVHSYALGQIWGQAECADCVDAGLAYLWNRHRDQQNGGYVWAVPEEGIGESAKQAYGHVFVLLAASSAKMAGHPDADRLFTDIAEILDQYFWEEGPGLIREEFHADWTPLSTYRGFNANMHGVEALLSAYEASGETVFLTRAGRILSFFMGRIAPAHGWRLPEHYSEDWQVDLTYAGDPMFRPRGTTPGHSFEIARLLLQYWDLSGRKDADSLITARNLIDRAFDDAWNADGGFAYTLYYSGEVQVADRYWWPVTEAIGAYSALLKVAPRPEDETRYRQIWTAAKALFIDTELGGWQPEIDASGAVAQTQFQGKPDIYHALQCDLIPLASGVSRLHSELPRL